MAESVVGCPSPQQVRRQAQEVISCHMQGQDELRDRLIREYCSDGSGALLDVTLAFFQSAVHVDHPPTAQHRFHFAITMLGDLIETVAGSLAVTEGELRFTPDRGGISYKE